MGFRGLTPVIDNPVANTGRRRASAPPFNVQPRPPITTPVPPARPTRQTYLSPRDLTINETAADQLIMPLFGPSNQGAKYIYANGFNNGATVYFVCGHGEGPIQSITPKIDNVAMTNDTGNHWTGRGGLIEAWTYLGTQTNFQETASGLFGLDPTWITNAAAPLNVYDNLVFTVIKWTWDKNANTDVPTFTFDILGNSNLYDPATGTRVYSENWALWIREVLTNTRWGAKIPTQYIDDTVWQTAESDCDVAVFPAVPTSPPTMALGAGGNPTGTYWYTYTNVTAGGVETSESPLSASYILAASQQIVVTLPASDSVTASRNIYRSADGDFPTRRRVGNLPGAGAGTFTDNMSNATWATQTPPTKVTCGTKRYSGGMACGTQSSLLQYIQTFRAHCLGVITIEQGKYQLRINKALPGGYTPQVFSEYHNWGGNSENPNVEPESIDWGRGTRADLFNEIEIKYTDRQNGWGAASVVKQRQSVIDGTEIPRRAVYMLPGLLENGIATRIAVQMLNLAYNDATFTLNADRSALKTQLWDVIALTGGGVAGQKVRIRSIKSNGEGFTLTGNEHSDASFSDTIQTADAPISAGSTGLPASFLTPPAIATPTWLEELFQDETGIWNSRGVISFTVPNFNKFQAVEVWVAINGGASRKWFEMTASPAVTPPLYDTGTYALSFYTRSISQQRSSATTLSVTVAKKTLQPADVPYLFAQQRGIEVLLGWQQHTDKDVAGYEIRKGTTSDTWSTATFVAREGATSSYTMDKPANSGGLPTGAWRYFIKAFDYSKHYSTNAATTDIVVANAGPALVETINSYIPSPGVSDTYNTDTFRSGSATYEGWRCNNSLAGVTVPGRYFLCRALSPQGAQNEITAAGYTSIQQWETSKDAPRRGGQGLWAPLDNPVTTGNFGVQSVASGSGQRNLELRVRHNGMTRVGPDNVDTITRLEPMLLGQTGPIGRTGPSGGNTLGGDLKFSTNNPLAQTMLLPTNGNQVVATTTERVIVALGPPVDLVTDSSGNASYTLPAALQLPASCTISITPTIVSSSSSSNGWKITSINNTSFTINVTNGSGSAIVGATVRVVIEDRGLGGTFVFS